MSKRLREWRLSRARAVRAEKPADPDSAEKFAQQVHGLGAARTSCAAWRLISSLKMLFPVVF
jgi:hypothetical protein